MFGLTKSAFRLSFGHLFTKSRQSLPLPLTALVAKEVVSYYNYAVVTIHLLRVIKINYSGHNTVICIINLAVRGRKARVL